VNPFNVDDVIQTVRFNLYRDDIEGAITTLETAHAVHPDPQYSAKAGEIRSWQSHLQDREAYVRVYEQYYRSVKHRPGLKLLEREIRTFLGRRTRKMVARCTGHPEYQLLEREVLAVEARRVLDAGCGEGRVALTLGARHPHIRVDGVEVSATNVGIARRLNRFPNVAFHEGLVEEMGSWLPSNSFDLAYSFAVLEHVRSVDETVTAILNMLRPGGRFCFVVPMNELKVTGPVPKFIPPGGILGHVRVFTEPRLRARFGNYPDFSLHKIPGEWRPNQYPECFVPVEFGSFFVAFSKPSST